MKKNEVKRKKNNFTDLGMEEEKTRKLNEAEWPATDLSMARKYRVLVIFNLWLPGLDGIEHFLYF